MSTLRLTGISKKFSGVPALRSVDFEVRAGEVHALLGANGAGKSTLIKILTGAYTADDGYIQMDVQNLSIQSPQDAKRYGIQCVYQEVDTALIPYLSVAENVLLDQQVQTSKCWINWTQVYEKAEQVFQQIGFSIPVRKTVGECSLSEKQLILIARAVAQKAKFVIFDEPTAPLSVQETERLFQIIEQLKQEEVGIIYISHRLDEVFRICDRITVLRDGRRIQTLSVSSTHMEEVISLMLGQSLAEEFPKQEITIGQPLLEVRGLCSSKIHDINLTVREGEIVAIVGLVGAGKTELARLLFGADPHQSGQILLKGKRIALRSPKKAVDAGIVLVPEERRKEGIFVNESVKNNLTVVSLLFQRSPYGWIKQAWEVQQSQDLVEKLGVKTSTIQQLVGHLSGGNQQKVAVGKWLPTKSHIFLFDEPTKGVDVGAKSDIYRLIGQLASEGKGILYFTCEFQEALGIADRILVMFKGKIVKELSRGEATQEKLMYYASGGV
jgi:simple sugar transport system ATP-binding protein